MDYNKVFKFIKYLSYVLLLGGVGVFVYFLVASLTNTAPFTDIPVGVDNVTQGSAQGTSVMLIYTYILFAIALLVTIIFPLINIIKNPKGSMRALIGLLAMIVVLGISYLFSSDAPVVNSAGGYFTNTFALKLTDTGLYAAYIALIGAFAAILFGELKNAFKK